ncbi:MAG: RpiB/LacA/LacB family sugar-phosphate isomerase [Clostridia bacterium]|nr:RpiB/LacA/LacB family sugar-phosphate isomerase [Clostridia bacterium]
MIVLASDHAGFELKEYLKLYFTKHKIEYIDAGALNYDPEDDYPDIIKPATKHVLKDVNNRGIFICGSGVGVNMVANRTKGIRAVLASDTQTAEMARLHNNANVLCLGARMICKRRATNIINTFLSTDFLGGKHQRRIDKF